jgi:hypothetical protein
MTVYADPDELATVGLSAELLASIDPAAVARALLLRSSFAEDFVARFYKLPLKRWGGSLSIAVAQLAAWDLVSSVVGFNPEGPGNAIWRDRRDEAMGTLERIALHGGPGFEDSSPRLEESAPVVATERGRGWGRRGLPW